MWYWLIVAIWAIGFPFAMNKIGEKWENNTAWEKFVAALIWPLTLVLYAIHSIHMKFK